MNAYNSRSEAIPADTVRLPAVAGSFYPAKPERLRKLVEDLLQEACPPAAAIPAPCALISPHAGYMYSGGVAAHAYKLLQDRPPATVAVIAPSHFERYDFISVFTGRSYRTPLGDLPVARGLAEKLLARDPHFVARWHGHRDQGERAEHALEVQLPFLQVAMPGCQLLPIVMGDNSWDNCVRLGESLATLAQETPLVVVASSDLSHYHPYGEAVALDRHFATLLQAGDPRRLHTALARRECEACGSAPIVAASLAAQRLGASAIEVLCYMNSGDISGDHSRVVGYLAASLSAPH